MSDTRLTPAASNDPTTDGDTPTSYASRPATGVDVGRPTLIRARAPSTSPPHWPRRPFPPHQRLRSKFAEHASAQTQPLSSEVMEWLPRGCPAERLKEALQLSAPRRAFVPPRPRWSKADEDRRTEVVPNILEEEGRGWILPFLHLRIWCYMIIC